MTDDQLAERARIDAGAKKLRGRAVERWPPFEVLWDLSVAARPKAVDDPQAQSAIAARDRDDLVLLCVPLAALQAAFVRNARRTPAEIWTIGNRDKAAGALFHWSEGRRMTPPLYAIWEERQITVAGGHHRVAVADAKGVATIPAYVARADLEQFQTLVPGATIISDAVIDDPAAWDNACKSAGTAIVAPCA